MDFLDCVHPLCSSPNVVLEGENTLKIKQILDICKIGHLLDYLLDYVDKSILDQSWVPLSNILNSYDELLECFHCHHSSLPKPSSHALKSKSHTIISHDPLAMPSHSLTPQAPDHFTYKPPSSTTT